MQRIIHRVLIGMASFPLALTAGTVLVTSLPDDAHPLEALTAVDGIPLTGETVVRVGAFPQMTDDQVLDAATEGLTELDARFVAFGAPRNIGDGADGVAGRFELALREAVPAGSPWVGEEVSLIVRKQGGQEFFVARFKGVHFAADPDTGLEQVLALHLADARAITGNRNGALKLATAPAPVVGGFGTWMDGYHAVIDPLLKLPAADADGDGRSNFLEYVTGTDPTSGSDPQPCQLYREGEEFWVRFQRQSGTGDRQPVVESCPDLVTPWQALDGVIEPDPSPPTQTGEWMRIRVPAPGEGGSEATSGFFRLKAGS